MVKSKVSKSKYGKRYPKEFQRQMVELHRAGNSVAELSKRFGPTQWPISRWIQQADRDEGRGDGGLTTAEREELARLRRENKRLQMEREILSNVWSTPRMQALSLRVATSTFRVNVSGLLVKPMASGLDGKPHASSLIKRSVMVDRIESQAFDAPVNVCAIRRSDLAKRDGSRDGNVHAPKDGNGR